MGGNPSDFFTLNDLFQPTLIEAQTHELLRYICHRLLSCEGIDVKEQIGPLLF